MPTAEALACVTKVFAQMYENRGNHFTNARLVRNFFDKAMMKQADRLFAVPNPTDQEWRTQELVDVERIE